jgi:hypothetical protein
MTITNLERYILECIKEQQKSMPEITFQTKLPDRIVHNALQRLIAKGVVKIRNDHYILDMEYFKKSAKQLNSPANIFREIKPIVNALLWDGVNKKETVHFKFKKFDFTKKDQAIFNNLLENIEEFINNNSIASNDNMSNQQLYCSMLGNYKNTLI